MEQVSRQRITSVAALPNGGFEIGLIGAAGETVTLGAADMKNSGAPVYASATIGSTGVATLKLQ